VSKRFDFRWGVPLLDNQPSYAPVYEFMLDKYPETRIIMGDQGVGVFFIRHRGPSFTEAAAPWSDSLPKVDDGLLFLRGVEVMDNPIEALLADLEAIDQDIIDMELAVKELKARVPDVLEAAMKTIPPRERKDLACWLYWHAPLVNTKTIAKVVLNLAGGSGLHQIVGPSRDHLKCGACGAPIEVSSRSELQRLQQMARRKSYRHTPIILKCQQCKDKERSELNTNLQQWRQAQEAQLEQLRTMPYQDYLQTEHWQQRRAKHLKSAGYRCQVCNAKAPLDVHHRTYDRRGEERYTDLIALCRDCHALYHDKLGGSDE